MLTSEDSRQLAERCARLAKASTKPRVAEYLWNWPTGHSECVNRAPPAGIISRWCKKSRPPSGAMAGRSRPTCHQKRGYRRSSGLSPAFACCPVAHTIRFRLRCTGLGSLEAPGHSPIFPGMSRAEITVVGLMEQAAAIQRKAAKTGAWSVASAALTAKDRRSLG
jgi:hypothetical protein